jgi:hypothetical protein
VDADGFADVLVGGDYADRGEVDEGEVRLFLGGSGGLGAAPAWTAGGGQAEAHFGVWRSGSAPLDFDGDGAADLAVGAIGHDDGEVDEGAAYLYRGVPGGVPAGPAVALHGDQADALYGHVASAGDVDGDGYDDLLVGAHLYDASGRNDGAAFLYRGRPLEEPAPNEEPLPEQPAESPRCGCAGPGGLGLGPVAVAWGCRRRRRRVTWPPRARSRDGR